MTEGEVFELVTLVAYEEAVPAPQVDFVDTPHAEFGVDDHDHRSARLLLPSPVYAQAVDPEVFGEGRYILVVLHELAHHIAWMRHAEEGHTPFMYGKLFQLCVRHGVDLVFAYENETTYQPRAARRGWELFKGWALA